MQNGKLQEAIEILKVGLSYEPEEPVRRSNIFFSNLQFSVANGFNLKRL